MAKALKDYLIQSLDEARKGYLDDLRAMTHEQLNAQHGGVARTGYDMTFECSVVNRRIAARLRGEDPGPWPFAGWAKAGPEHCDKERAIRDFTESAAEVSSALTGLEPERLYEKIKTPQGEVTGLELATIAVRHLAYHDGQLNFIQALGGDGEVHWS